MDMLLANSAIVQVLAAAVQEVRAFETYDENVITLRRDRRQEEGVLGYGL